MSVIQRIKVSELVTRTLLIKPSEPRSKSLIPEAGEKAIYLGHTDILRKPVFWRPEKLVNPHITILGGTGFGKSTTIETLISRASIEFNSNILVMDFTGEYVVYAEMVGGHVIQLGRDAINVLDLGNGISPGIKAKQTEIALKPFLDTEKATRQARILRILTEEAYKKKGITNNIETWNREPPTLKDVCNLLGELIFDAVTGDFKSKEYNEQITKIVQMMASSHSMRESAIGLLEKLEVYTKPPNDVLARHSTIQLEELFESGFVVINLSKLPDENSRSSVAISILQFLVEYMRNKGLSKNPLQLIVVLDEAWKVISIEQSPVKPLYKEGRKYGVGVIVSTQDVTDVQNYITNNAGTTLLLKLQGQDRESVTKSMKLDPRLNDKIDRLGVGEGIVFMNFAKEYIEPFVMKVDPVIPEKFVQVVFKLPSNPMNQLFPDALKRYRLAK